MIHKKSSTVVKNLLLKHIIFKKISTKNRCSVVLELDIN